MLSLNDRNLHRIIESPGRMAAVLLLNLSRSLAERLARTTAELNSISASVSDEDFWAVEAMP